MLMFFLVLLFIAEADERWQGYRAQPPPKFEPPPTTRTRPLDKGSSQGPN